MIKALIDKVATSLVTLNSSWLSEVRTVGYLHKRPEGDTITFDGLKDIGLTDIRGNSGYIRFKSDQNGTIQELPFQDRRSTCEVVAQRFSIDLRLIIAAKAQTPEDLPFELAAQMNSIAFTEEAYKERNVKIRATSFGTNTLANVKTETGKDDLNNDLSIIFIDFKISFDWRQACDNTPITIIMGCENTDFTDYGCVQLCDGVVLNQDSIYTGVMSFKTYFNGIQVNKAFDVVENEPITIPTEDLNANYQYIIELYNEAGELVNVLSNDPTPTSHEALRITITP